jgi:hypothetical protein
VTTPRRSSVEPYELLDQDCPDAVALLESVNAEVAAEGLNGEAAFLATLAKLNPRAAQHKSSCPRCRSFDPRRTRRDERSAVWGGGTLGLLVGLVAGFFRDNYWETVALAVLIGAVLGLGANLLAWGSKRVSRL